MGQLVGNVTGVYKHPIEARATVWRAVSGPFMRSDEKEMSVGSLVQRPGELVVRERRTNLNENEAGSPRKTCLGSCEIEAGASLPRGGWETPHRLPGLFHMLIPLSLLQI